MTNKNDETIAKTIIAALSEFPDETVKTITCDHCIEFVDWQTIEKDLTKAEWFSIIIG